jgi:uncharacterized membrane protein YfcA
MFEIVLNLYFGIAGMFDSIFGLLSGISGLVSGFWWFLCLIPLVSFLYASVGHGGASGYLALMALFAFPPDMMKPTALLLNLFVAGIAFISFYRAGYFKKSLFLSFALGSIPFAYLGGSISADPDLYKKILGLVLIIAVLRMIAQLKSAPGENRPIPFLAGVSIGAGIGFFSGLIGIGGGIILTPVLVLLRWASVKEAAAVSALFIWVNSASGFIGQWHSGVELSLSMLPMIALALLGGLLGSHYGSLKWQSKILRYVLAGVLSLASVKLLWI